MKKHYVFDTNVLLHDPQAIFKFADNNVVISIAVIEEIDRFKKEMTETGRNARLASRYIDELRKQGPLSQGVQMKNGGMLIVDIGSEDHTQAKIFPIPKHTGADEEILATAIRLKKRHKDLPVVFVTKDTNLRILADAMGIPAVDYDPDQVELDELYTGWGELELKSESMQKLRDTGELNVEDNNGFYPNQFFIVRDPEHPSMSLLTRYYQEGSKLSVLKTHKEIWGVKPKNLEQTFSLELLLDDSIQLVTLVGKAGTGKTLLALAAGLHATIEEGAYSRLLVSRPVYPLGKDIGFLPGDLEEKLLPWMQPIFDNIEFLVGTPERSKLGTGRRREKAYRSHYHLMNMGVLQIEPLTYIRGRSIPNQYLLVDEAQNLTPHEIKTIVTRVGYGTKIIITGDPYQIDNPYVDVSNNGLTYVVERFKSQPMAGQVFLTKGERSDLAELAANLL